MKHLIVTAGLGFLWGCSGDPNAQGSRSPKQANVSAADAQSSGISNGTVLQPDSVPGGSMEGPETGGHEADTGQPVTAGKGDAPVLPVATAPVYDGEGGVTPPQKVTGAFLVGTLLPHEEGEPFRVGLVAKKDEERLSDAPESYRTAWSLSSKDEILPVSLAKSSNAAYDRILLFEGSEDEFMAAQEFISVQVSVLEGSDDNGLRSLIASTLTELLGL